MEIPKEYLDKLKIYQAQIRDIEREIEKAEKAGIEVEELKTRLQLAKDRIDKLLAVYGRR